MDEHVLHVGIDFSKKRADVGFYGPDGKPLRTPRAFSNSRTGFEQFKQLVLETLEEHGYSKVKISGEATSTYWMPFFLEIEQDEALQEYDCQSYLLNPRWVYDYKKCHPRDHKTDTRDTFYIADRSRVIPPRYEWQSDMSWQSLRFLTRTRFHLVQSLTRAKNFFHAYLFVYNNAYARKHPFSDLFGKNSVLLLRNMDEFDEEVDPSDPDTILTFLKELEGYRLTDLEKTITQLQSIAANRFQLDEHFASTLHWILNQILTEIEFLASQIEQIDKQITLEAKHHPEVEILSSIPGIGPVFSAGIAAEIGSLARFFAVDVWDAKHQKNRSRNLREVDAAIAKYAGLWWPISQSGNYSSQKHRLDKTGNHYLRYYLVQAAEQMRRRVPGMPQYYKDKYNQVNQFQHKRALVLLARKNIRLIVGLLHRMEPFCSKEEAT